MPGLRPTKAFTGVTLELATIKPGHRFGRIYHERYPDPLGLGKTKSRFSDPRRRLHENERFGVLYLGSTLKGCFIEAILRDRRNGAVGDYPIEEAEFLQRRYAEIVVTSSTSLGTPMRILPSRRKSTIMSFMCREPKLPRSQQ